MRRLLVLITLLCITRVAGQGATVVIPPSPSAQTITKYNDYPVSHLTGVPQINIPLYTIKSGDIALPLALNYHAGGFRVEEEASWVGLGWTLSVQGLLSSTVRGFPDASPFGYSGSAIKQIPDIIYSGNPQHSLVQFGQLYHDNGYTIPAGFNGFSIDNPNDTANGKPYLSRSLAMSSRPTVNGVLADYRDIVLSTFDWEPDYYSINAFGLQGKFVFDQKGVPHFEDQSNIQVTRNDSGTWIVKAPNGWTYEFAAKGTIEAHNGITINVGSSWYITSITSTTGKQIHFSYSEEKKAYSKKTKSYNYKVENESSLQDGQSIRVIEDRDIQESLTVYFDPYLERIDFDNGYALFKRSASQRLDLKAKKLEAIEIYNTNDTLIKSFDFVTDYFSTTTSVTDPNNTHRLRLDKVIENSGPDQKTYSLGYVSNQLPKKNSLAKDYWGYYNGESNSHLIPSYIGVLNFYNRARRDWFPIGLKVDGAKRQSNPNVIGACLLEKITYPTGGYREFEFESNTYTPSGFSNTEIDLSTYNERNFRYYKDYSGVSGKTTFSGKSMLIIPDNETFIKGKLRISANKMGYPNDIWGGFTARDVAGKEKHTGGFDPTMLPVNPNNTSGFFGGDDTWDLGFGMKSFYFDMKFPSNPSVTTQVSFNLNYEVVVDDFIRTPQPCGGVRIKTQRSYDPLIGKDVSVKKYVYEENILEDGKYLKRSKGVLRQSLKFHSTKTLPTQHGDNKDNTFNFLTGQSQAQTCFGNNSVVGYSKVVEFNEGNGKTIYKYNISTNRYLNIRGMTGTPNSIPYQFNGKIGSKSVFNEKGQVLAEKKYRYNLMDETHVPALYQGRETPQSGSDYIGKGLLVYYPYITRWEVPRVITDTQFFYKGDDLQTAKTVTTLHDYDNPIHKGVTKTTVYDGIGDTTVDNVITKAWYPDDVKDVNSLGTPLTDPEFAAIARLKTGSEEFRPGQPVQSQTERNGQKSVQRTNFKYWNAKFTLPEFVQTAKNNDALEKRLVYKDYDLFGNPLEVAKEDGIPVSYIWGYNYSYPIAKIVNATRDDIASALGITPEKLRTYNEGNLAAINGLRSLLPNAQITTFTYTLLVGVESVTDPSGYTMSYEYDEFQRLKFVKDAEENILSENQYKYKNN